MTGKVANGLIRQAAPVKLPNVCPTLFLPNHLRGYDLA